MSRYTKNMEPVLKEAKEIYEGALRFIKTVEDTIR